MWRVLFGNKYGTRDGDFAQYKIARRFASIQFFFPVDYPAFYQPKGGGCVALLSWLGVWRLRKIKHGKWRVISQSLPYVVLSLLPKPFYRRVSVLALFVINGRDW